jgi:hypothetical protein
MLTVPSRISEAKFPYAFPRGCVFILWLSCIETDARPLTVLLSYVGSAGCTDISKSGGRSASLAAVPAWLQQWIVLWEVSLFSTCLNATQHQLPPVNISISLTILHIMGH